MKKFTVELTDREVNSGKPLEIEADYFDMNADFGLQFHIREPKYRTIAIFAKNTWIFVRELTT